MSGSMNPATGATGTTGSATGMTGGASTSRTGTGVSATTTVPTTGGTALPEIIIHYQTFTSDNSWPPDLILDCHKLNWLEMDHCLNMLANQQCFSKYLDGTLACPNPVTNAQLAMNWKRSDHALWGLILEHISERDYEAASVHAISHDLYVALCVVHQNQGIHTEIHVMKEALNTHFLLSIPLSQTLDKLKRLHKRFVAMGKLDDDKLMIIYIMNTLGNSYMALQLTINRMLENITLTSLDIEKWVLTEDDLISYQEKTNNTAPENTTLAAVSNKQEKTLCTDCKQPGHHAKFCIKVGGQMAGKTLNKACAAQSAAHALQRSCNNQGNMTPQLIPSQANTADNSTMVVTINGKCYVLDNTASTTTENNTSALIVLMMKDYDHKEYIAVLTTADNPLASVDWHPHSQVIDDTTPVTYSAGKSPIAYPNKLPFILNTSGMCHILPEPSDFKVLKTIPCHPVKGLCGSTVYATGISDIKLHTAGGHKLKLTNILYVPQSHVQLVSILVLNKGGDHMTHFDSNRCWVMNKSNTILIWGSLSNSKWLYVLSMKTPYIHHSKPSPSLSTALSTIVPNLKTWHHHLGHCNIKSIINMAKGKVSEGMQIDLSSHPAKCDHCALEKSHMCWFQRCRREIRPLNGWVECMSTCVDWWLSLPAQVTCIPWT